MRAALEALARFNWSGRWKDRRRSDCRLRGYHHGNDRVRRDDDDVRDAVVLDKLQDFGAFRRIAFPAVEPA